MVPKSTSIIYIFIWPYQGLPIYLYIIWLIIVRNFRKQAITFNQINYAKIGSLFTLCDN